MTANDQHQAPIPLAATVVLLHDGPQGLQVLMLRRREDLAFYGGAWVFPGGCVDSIDYGDGGVNEAARRAAVREVHEEAGLRVEPAQLCHFAQWVTPPGRTRRYDTFFFVARLPDLRITLDEREVDAHRLLSPQEALQAHRRGELKIPPPTFVTLLMLQEHEDVQQALIAFGDSPPQRFQPRPVKSNGRMIYLYEPDSGYPHHDPNTPGKRHRLIANGTDWIYERS